MLVVGSEVGLDVPASVHVQTLSYLLSVRRKILGETTVHPNDGSRSEKYGNENITHLLGGTKAIPAKKSEHKLANLPSAKPATHTGMGRATELGAVQT